MNAIVNEIARSVTGKTSLDDCSTEELRQITSSYPFFAPAHFLYAKKLNHVGDAMQQTYTEKASLYFQNPVWFHSLLHKKFTVDSTQTQGSSRAHAAEFESPSTFEEVVDQTNNGYRQPASAPVAQEEITVAEEKPIPQFRFQPIDPAKTALTFEPYHTVDYFASQGIKMKEEGKPKDRFSLQLKSFTEWLKEMKRLPTPEKAVNVTPSDEKKVEKMAEVSINDREVWTEAMAEVWEKQGNRDKARQVYEKLSLHNPSKSSYFAAKIEHLKNL